MLNKKIILASLILFTLLSITPVRSQDEICVYLFYSWGCPHCAEVESYLEELSLKYPILIEKISAPENEEMFKEYLQAFNVPQNDWGKVPTVFVDDHYCIGDTPCIDSLEEIIKSCYDNGGCTCPTTDGKDESHLTVTGLAGLAAVDAINPCALAVLTILLTSILLKYPKQKLKALTTGISFTFSIFICYFALGLLIVLGFKSVTGLSSLSSGLFYKILGVFAIIIGIFNIKDYFKYGGGFLMEVPLSWRPKMKSIINSTTSPLGAFFVGAIVSLFLLPCTSGPYFVAGGLLSGITWLNAFPLLLIYNVIFVAPMIGITVFVYSGFASVESVAGWRERNIKRLHLFAGLIILALGIAIIFGLI
jgi:glutaredoxin